MKKIIVSLLVSLVCFLGYAQTPYPTPNPFGSKGTMTNAQGGWKIDSTAIMPVYADTFAANRSKTSLYAGSLIRVGDDYYYRSADTSKWLLLAITTSNCAGTQLISGSITWSGSGLVYDATDLDYYILCSRYFANSTTLTLAVADPTYPRIDKFYADNTGNIGVITGTPSATPQEPAINPLTQIDMGFVYIPAGSTVPAGTTQTVIYNENVEWSGTSDVPSVNFDYATNPYIGSLSTYIPSAPNDSYISWQYGTTKRFIDVQYLKLWVRINEAFVSRPSPFLDVSFYNGSTKVSADSYVEDGVYNFDFNLIGEWQLVSIPLQGLVVSDSIFDKVNFVIHSAPTSFQLDYVYLLETATVPPVISSGWALNLNTGTNPTTNGIGTSDSVGVAIKTNSETRAIMPANGLQLVDDTTYRVMVWNETTKEWAVTYQPTILADSPLVIYTDVYQDRIKADTTRRGAALATQYYADSVANAGGGGWSLLGNAGTNVSTDFIGTTDDVGLRFKVNNNNAGYIDKANFSTSFGIEALNGAPTGDFNNAFGYSSLFSITTGTENNAVGHASLYSNQTGSNNNAYGYSSLYLNTGSKNNAFGYRSLVNSISGTMNTAMGDSSLVTLTTGSRNTAIGANADVATSSTDSAVAIGFEAVATTKQLAFSPHLTTMFLNLDSASGTAPAIAGIDENGNWRKYATPSGGSSQWTDTTAGIYYADKVGIGGVMNPDNALTVTGSATVGTAHSNAGTNNFISGSGSTVGIGGNNIIAGSDHAIANNQGGNAVFGETQTLGNAEASSIIYGYGNAVGDNANDALVGGTGSSIFGAASIALGVANTATVDESISIGGGGNAANGIYSGTFAGVNHEAEDSAAVVIGGQNNSASGVNAAIIGGENNATLARNTVILGGSSVVGTMANTTYVDSLRVGGKIVAPNLPTSNLQQIVSHRCKW